MRGKVAKSIRKRVYRDMSSRHKREEYSLSAKTGELVAPKLRRFYKMAKRRHMGTLYELPTPKLRSM